MTAAVTLPTPTSVRATPALAAAVGSGALVALQQRINGELGVSLSAPLLAAVVSFSTGLLVITAVVLSRPTARAAWAGVRAVPWWSRLAGLGGASLVTAGAFAAPRIGVALFTVGLVAGQTTGGLVVDRLGLGAEGAHAVTAPRLLGAALCVVAVGLSALGPGTRDVDPVLLTGVVMAGALVSVQQALNGRVRRITGDPGVATLVNFIGGTVALVLAAVLWAALRGGLPDGDWPGPDRWYLYLGGPVAVVFVGVAAAVVRRVGVLRLGLAVIAGQLAGSIVVDVVLPAADTGIAATTVLGAALTFVAVVVSGLGVRRA